MAEEPRLNYLTDKWSFSKCSTWAKCPRRFWYRYVMKMREGFAPWLLFGRAVHEGQETDAYAKLRGEKLTVGQVLDSAAEAFKDERKKEGLKDKDLPLDPFVAAHRRQLEVFESSGERALIVPAPGSVEAPFEMDILVGDPEHGLEPALVEGYTDVVSVDENGDRTVVDYKSAGRPTSKKEVEDHDQLALEAIGAEAKYGKIVTFVKHAKQKATTKVTDPVPSTKGRLERVLAFLADTIHGARRAMKTGDFPRCDPQAFYCQRGKACEYGWVCRPDEQKDLAEFVQVEKLRPVGSLPPQEWRESGAAKKERERSAKK